METDHRTDTLDHRPASGHGLLSLGVWMRLSVAGAAVAVVGLGSLLDAAHALPVLTAVTWIAAGGTFSWLAWQRARVALDALDANEPARPDPDRLLRNRPVSGAPASL